MSTPAVAERRGGWRPSPLLVASAGVHGVALSSLVGAPASWETVLAAIVANHLVIATAGMLPRCGWLGPNLTRIPAEWAGDSLVALTFDDGPDPNVTPVVLDLLDQAGARATFFCIGERAEAYPDLIATIRDSGHGIENHTYSHPNSFALRGPRSMMQEVIRAQDGIQRVAGRRPRFFRAPAGIQNPWLSPILASAGVSLVSWTRRGFDTVSDNGAHVASRLTRRLAAGDILLLHDGVASNKPWDGAVMLDALTRLLDTMRRLQLQSECLDTLLRNSVEGPQA